MEGRWRAEEGRVFPGGSVSICDVLIGIFLSLYSQNVRAIAFIVQELCESRGGRPGLSVLTSLTVSVDVKQY